MNNILTWSFNRLLSSDTCFTRSFEPSRGAPKAPAAPGAIATKGHREAATNTTRGHAVRRGARGEREESKMPLMLAYRTKILAEVKNMSSLALDKGIEIVTPRIYR